MAFLRVCIFDMLSDRRVERVSVGRVIGVCRVEGIGCQVPTNPVSLREWANISIGR